MPSFRTCRALFGAFVLLYAGSATGMAHADAPSVLDQFAAARKAFLAETSDTHAFMTDYRAKLFDGMEGYWTQLTMLAADKIDAATLDAACKSLAFHLSPKDAYSFVVSVKTGSGRELETTFVSMGGNSFAFTADPGKLMHFLGLDGDGASASLRDSALAANSGVAQVFRPSPDIIVVQSSVSAPRVYGRCG